MAEKATAKREDFRIDDDLAAADRTIERLIAAEERRQVAKLILIASESIAPPAVRAALGSVFTNIYAEGYPALRTSKEEEEVLAETAEELALYRRYADRRYYKGTEFVDLVEALAQRRVAELFANDRVRGSEILANVQPLSGAAANNAVYEALLQPGDTILGLALSHGGHLTHGSPYNRSGRYYKVVPYTVNLRTGRLDYEEIRNLAREHRPKLIIAGASAYPWEIDWAALRAVADEVPGALLLADVAHPAGLVVAGLFPNPVGHAHVVSFTTHKTLCGPRGAAILTTDEALARKIDRAVFPGEQGGPHVNNIAAMAVAFRIAQTPRFRALQRQVVANAQALAAALQALGVKLVYGGTSTHMLLVDLNALPTATGYPLKGDVASRVLDLTGIVCNRNTIPGDLSAAQASGLRFGTVWATQRGLREPDMAQLAQIIARTLGSIVPFHYIGPDGDLGRGKVPFAELQAARRAVTEMLATLPDYDGHDRPGSGAPAAALEISGRRARQFLTEVCAGDLFELEVGEARRTTVLDPAGQAVAGVQATRLPDDRQGRERYWLAAEPARLAKLRDWLEALADGYVLFDEDVYAKVEGAVVVAEAMARADERERGENREGAGRVDLDKPYFVGQRALLAAMTRKRAVKEPFEPRGYEGRPRRSALYEEHLSLNVGRNLVPFAGWLMPLWYTSIREEHRAVRWTAALFDISHMGVLEISGPGAERFLDLVTTNHVPVLTPGQSHYSYILDPDGNVLDDVFLYCRAPDRYMLVANAANAERVQSWLEAVNTRRYLIDRERPGVAADAQAEIRSLKDAMLVDEGRVDLALQGPQSLRVLLAAVDDGALAGRVAALRKTAFLEGAVAGVPALISRTGYTGEELGFELYVPPAQAPTVWRHLLERGAPFGLRPAGLGARDSARAEAGFPLYGHELGGSFQISPAGAGYGQFVKLHKPFFIGRRPFIERERQRTQEVVRFRLNNRGARMLRQGDPVVDERGECLGYVTSSVVVEGQQVGMAYVTRGRLVAGSPIRAFALSRLKEGGEKPKRELAVGDQVLIPEEGVVLPRFGLRPDGWSGREASSR